MTIKKPLHPLRMNLVNGPPSSLRQLRWNMLSLFIWRTQEEHSPPSRQVSASAGHAGVNAGSQLTLIMAPQFGSGPSNRSMRGRGKIETVGDTLKYRRNVFRELLFLPRWQCWPILSVSLLLSLTGTSGIWSGIQGTIRIISTLPKEYMNGARRL